jgi:hypothetical protein
MIQKQEILVGDIFQGITQYGSNQRDKPLSALPLFLKRGKSNVLLPENDRSIHAGDRILMCGTQQAQYQMNRVLTNIQTLENILYGREVSASVFWKWLTNRR